MEERIGCIYAFRNKETGQMYIGQTIDVERRYKEHINKRNVPKNSRWYKATKNRSVEQDFEFLILEYRLLSKKALDGLERYWIKRYGTFEFPSLGYNSTPGGDGFDWSNKKAYEEMVERNRAMAKDPIIRKKHQEALNRLYSDPEYMAWFIEQQNKPETRKKKSESLRKAYQRPGLKEASIERFKKYYASPEGQKRRKEIAEEQSNSPEWRAKATIAARKRAADPEWHEATANRLKAMCKTKEWQDKHRHAMQNKSQEWEQKRLKNMKEKRCIKIRCIENGKVFDSCTEACEFARCSAAQMSRAIHGKVSNAGGYHWEIYKPEDTNGLL